MEERSPSLLLGCLPAFARQAEERGPGMPGPLSILRALGAANYGNRVSAAALWFLGLLGFGRAGVAPAHRGGVRCRQRGAPWARRALRHLHDLPDLQRHLFAARLRRLG